MQRKQLPFNFTCLNCVWWSYHQEQKNRNCWSFWSLYEQMQRKQTTIRILSDVNIIRCRKTGITEFCLMSISSDAVKRDIMEFSLMLISSDAANRCHWILSDFNVVRCRKAAIIECHEMLTSSDAEKRLMLIS